MTANAVLTEQDTEKVTDKTFHNTGKGTEKNDTKANIVRVAKQPMPKPQSVNSVMVTTKAEGLLPFDSDYELASKGGKSAKGVVEVLRNHPFCILVSNVLRRTLKMEKHLVWGGAPDDIDENVITDPQISEDGMQP